MSDVARPKRHDVWLTVCKINNNVLSSYSPSYRYLYFIIWRMRTCYCNVFQFSTCLRSGFEL